MADESNAAEFEKSTPTARRRASGTRKAVSDTTLTRSAEPELADSPVTDEADVQKKPRFHFFIIDSGWDSAAARVIRDNIDMITRFQNHDPLFILTREQSTALMQRHPHLIGKDPILLARDMQARGASGGSEYHGFHLNLGLIQEPSKAVKALRKFLYLLATHRQSTDIERDVRQLLHRKGLTGAVEVLRLGSEAMMG